MNSTPFYLKPVEHDRRLARRYLWQSLARIWAATMMLAACIGLLFTVLLWSVNLRTGFHPGWTWSNWFSVIWPILIPFAGVTSLVQRRLRELAEAGTPLTAEMLSSRPSRMLTSPLDPLTTYNVCTETLSGLSLGLALGYGGPAAFHYSPFAGRILISRRRPVWLTQCTEVLVSDAEVRIRRRFGLDFFSVQRGDALHAVETVAAHLRRQFDLRAHALQAARREQELERAALSAKLSALQAQVEPHFLLNTLANLKYLIRTDAETAQQMLDHLVGYLQNALPDMRSVSSTLERELALVRSYLSIMQIRMGQRLRFRIEAGAEALAQPFPPAMLISLVENAIKHGLERASRPGEIVISAALRHGVLCVQVSDNGAGLTAQMGQGLGLANIHERLQLLYGGRASLTVEDHGGVTATLTIEEQACAPH